MSLVTILLIVLIVMAFGAMPRWAHSRQWGYWPSSGLGLLALVLIVLLLTGNV